MADTQNMQRLFQTAGTGQQRQQGTGFTNLNRLMEASKENLLGQKVAGNIQQQIGGVQQQLSEQQKQFQEQAEKSKVGGQKDIEQRQAVLGRFTSPSGTGEGPTEEETAAFQRFQSGQYTGPQGLKDTGALRSTAQQLQGQVSSFSPSGTQELLRRSVGGDRYTQGQQRLDALLLNRGALTPVTRQASTLGQEIGRAETAASGQAELNKNLAQQFAKETQEQLTRGMGGIETAVKGQLATAEAQEKERQAKIQAIQDFAAGRRAKVDASGNVVKDQYGNTQYEEGIRGGGSVQEQMDRLSNLLREKGLQTGEIEQVFGKGSLAQAEAKRQQDLAAIERQKHAQAFGELSEIGGYGLVDQLDPTSKLRNYVTGATPENSGYLDVNRIKSGIESGELSLNDLNSLSARSTYFGDQSGTIPEMISKMESDPYMSWAYFGKYNPMREAANQQFLAGTGMAGQAALGGSQEQFYKNLAATLANQSKAAQGLTEQGVATGQQRASYEALNKLLGKTPSEAKYRTGDTTKYEAGNLLINPEQLKRTL